LTNEQAVGTALEIMSAFRKEKSRLDLIHDYVKGDYAPKVYVPTKATNQGAQTEYARIIERSKQPVLSLVVDALSQNLRVDGFRPARASVNAASWAHWQANRMDARQEAIHRGAIQYGAHYNVILPGALSGARVPVWRPVGARRMLCVFEDSENDEWPLFGLERWAKGSASGTEQAWRLYDSEQVYLLTGSLHGPASMVEAKAHDTGFTPIVRYLGSSDPDGEALGEVWPLIVFQDQLDGSSYNIEMAQSYAVHRQRWATGLAIPEDDDGNPTESFKSAIDRLWVAEDTDTKFGEFAQTEIKSWLDAREDTRRAMAIKSQLPPGHMLGEMANLSAEALAATEAPQQRRGRSFKTNLGEAHEQSFRLDALQSGDEAGWEDVEAQVVWADMESRSLSQVADALGKLAAQLGIPARGLWEKIPGVTDGDLEAWESMRTEEMAQSAEMAARSFGVDFAQPAEAAGAA
jgi:hypothetical protein